MHWRPQEPEYFQPAFATRGSICQGSSKRSAVRDAEVRMVHEVEELGAELQNYPAREDPQLGVLDKEKSQLVSPGIRKTSRGVLPWAAERPFTEHSVH